MASETTGAATPVTVERVSVADDFEWRVLGDFRFPALQIIELVDTGDHDEQVAITAPVCDFCFDLRVRWQYPCEQFVLEGFDWGSADEWLACDICSTLIEAENWPDLLARSFASWALRLGTPSVQEVGGVTLLQRAFRTNRSGEREAFG